MPDEIQPRPDLFEPKPRPILSDEEIAERLAPFSEGDHDLIGYRFGLDRGGMPRNIDEVAEHFGTTRAEARKAETRAMANRNVSEDPAQSVNLRANLRRKLFTIANEEDTA